jgi:uncharacterized membrane protein
MSDLICVAFKDKDTADCALNELRAMQAEYLSMVLPTSLTNEQEDRLREALSGATSPEASTAAA